MGSNKFLYVVIVLLLAAIVAGGVYFFLNKQATKIEIPNQPTAASETPPAPSPAPINGTLSEQPNQVKYDEYFSDIYLGIMAIGKKIGTDGFPTKTNVFTDKTDQLCMMMTLKKIIPSGKLAIAIYDAVAKKDDQSKTIFPVELKAGGIGGCNDLTQSSGKYEYKLYVDDVLAVVLPFEVK